ncbi:MAG: hypothetical protein CHACPFDD_01759 [Phycisphaerae bacterium]|nr:hypothetical protein [Phycisphaerae bacterium]
MTASASEQDVQTWTGLGRHVQLAPACDLLGVRLRGLHPDWAARGLGTSAEFAAHFRDSYAPLIRRAIQHGQAVLAWRGWEGEPRPEWGLIESSEGDLFLGRGAADGAERRLIGPAHLVYVVEAVEPRDEPPCAQRRLDFAVRSARRFWNDEPAEDGVLLGRAAYARWAAAARQPAMASDLLAALATVKSARHALARWLAVIGPQCDRGGAERCRTAVARLEKWRDAWTEGEATPNEVLERGRETDEAVVAGLSQL